MVDKKDWEGREEAWSQERTQEKAQEKTQERVTPSWQKTKGELTKL
jgi:hypothetical protein